MVLSADEQKLYDLAFRSLRPREFLSLAVTGEWRDASAGQQVLTEGEPVSSISIPIAGSVQVSKGGKPLGTLEPGQLVGTSLALTGHASLVDAKFTGTTRYMRWLIGSLRAFMDKRPELRVTLQGLANRDLAGKLERLLAVVVGPTYRFPTAAPSR